MQYPVTPDRRYFVVRGRLWRCSNPELAEEERSRLVQELMNARRAVKQALHQEDEAALETARHKVNTAKIALGERGEVWWTDGAPDYNQKLVKNTPYADWYAALSEEKT
ncbi:hypothetical protein [Phormidesmis priestleyi]